VAANEAADAAQAAAQAARTSYGRLVALLAWRTGDLAAAEDALAEAFHAALRTWPHSGVPDNPAAWLLTAARRQHIDHWRSAAHRLEQAVDPVALSEIMDARPGDDSDALPDRRLHLLFVCAHPAIAAELRAPLMLQTVLGL
jgi:RNA polymerase sigma-70 factor (ECF subfamily)